MSHRQILKRNPGTRIFMDIKVTTSVQARPDLNQFVRNGQKQQLCGPARPVIFNDKLLYDKDRTNKGG